MLVIGFKPIGHAVAGTRAAAPELDWLNKGVFVRVARRQPGGVIYVGGTACTGLAATAWSGPTLWVPAAEAERGRPSELIRASWRDVCAPSTRHRRRFRARRRS
jgi:hypothetical protein